MGRSVVGMARRALNTGDDALARRIVDEFGVEEDGTVRALSLHQPWADMICSGKKTIETRFWKTDVRGPLVICSTKKPEGMGDTGVTICLVDLVDCCPLTIDDHASGLGDELQAAVDNGKWALVLENIRPLRRIPVSGGQRFWKLSADSIELQ